METEANSEKRVYAPKPNKQIKNYFKKYLPIEQQVDTTFPPSRYISLLFTFLSYLFKGITSLTFKQQPQPKLQQKEHSRTFNDLSENHRMAKLLFNFQKKIASCKNKEDVFLHLVSATTLIFPFKKTAVLLLRDAVHPGPYTPAHSFTVISESNNSKHIFEDTVLKEITDCLPELSRVPKMVIGVKQDWIALPIRVAQNKMIAVFLASAKPGFNPSELPESLYLFLSFAEQVVQNLLSLQQAKETMQHVSSLYKAVETISSRDDLKEITTFFGAYAKALTGCEKTIFWMEQLNSEKTGEEINSIFTVKGLASVFPEECWYPALLQAWSEIKDYPRTKIKNIEDHSNKITGQLICVPVKSRSKCFGMLAALQAEKKIYNVNEIVQKLSFLSNLGAISIERNIAEVFSDKLLLIEEQKRIAAEIHDNISQNLFSIVYGLEAAVRQHDKLSAELKNRLDLIQDLAARTAKELRVLVYRLSPQQRGDSTFINEVGNYLNGLANINQVTINFKSNNKEEFLSSAMRSAFYRIIKEATGNAIRHSKCLHIDVSLKMGPLNSLLIIADDGTGFDVTPYNNPGKAQNSLGIINMKELAHSLQGTFHIESKIGLGTKVTCTAPTAPAS